MGNFNLNLSADDLEGDGSKEILITISTGPEDSAPFSIYAYSSEKNGFYDRCSSPGDADGDGQVGDDNDDKILFLNLANAFAAMKGYAAKHKQ